MTKKNPLNVWIEGEDRTLRSWLKDALMELWVEGDSFSGKRPLGNSGWYGSICDGLEAAGFDDPDTVVRAAIMDAFEAL